MTIIDTIEESGYIGKDVGYHNKVRIGIPTTHKLHDGIVLVMKSLFVSSHLPKILSKKCQLRQVRGSLYVKPTNRVCPQNHWW